MCGEPFLRVLRGGFLGNKNSVDVQTKMQMCAFQKELNSSPVFLKKPIHFLSFPQNTMSLETGIKI